MAAVLVGGCDREQPQRVWDSIPAPPHATPEPQSQPATMTWTAPDHWQPVPSDQAMRVATYQAGEGPSRLEVVVSQFPGDVGGTLANVNRWRSQMGLSAITEAELAEQVKPFQTTSTQGLTMRIAGAAGRDMLAAIIMGDQGRTWFVRAEGEPDVVASHEADFVAFAGSFRMQTAQQPEASHTHPPISSGGMQPQRPSELLFDLPAQWHAHQPRSPIVYAMFHTAPDHGPDTGEITITPLLGDGGGLLPNVNMWRGQVGLPPVADLTDQRVDKVTVAGRSVDVVVLDGPAGSAANPALSAAVAIIADRERTWFIKLIGPRATVHSQMPQFLGFVESIRVAGE